MATPRSPLRVNGRRRTLSVLLGSFCVWAAGCAVSFSDAAILNANHATLVTRSESTDVDSSPGVRPSAAVVVTAGKSATKFVMTTGFCLGYAIAPRFVLVSTECLQHEFHAVSLSSAHTLEVKRDVNEDTGVAVVKGSWAPQILNGASFVLLQTAKPLAGTSPALLQSARDDQSVTEAKATDAVLSLVTFDSTTALSAWTSSRVVPISMCALQLQPHGKKSKLTTTEWLCVDVDDSGSRSVDCKAASASLPPLKNETEAAGEKPFVADGFLVSIDTKTQREVLWGIVWTSESTCDTESAGAPLTMAVNTVETIRGLIETHALGYQWVSLVQALTAPPVTVPPTADPPSQSGSSGDMGDIGDMGGRVVGSYTSSGSSDDVELPSEPSTPEIFIPAWMDEVMLNAALLTPTNDTTQPNATIGFFVTARHLVVPRLWFDGDISTLKYATTTSRMQLKITKIVSETEFYGSQSATLAAALQSHSDLVVFEIDQPVEFTYSVLVPPPKEDVVYAQSQLHLFDAELQSTTSEVATTAPPKQSSDGSADDPNAYSDKYNDGSSGPHVVTIDGDKRFVGLTKCGEPQRDPSASTGDPEMLCVDVQAKSVPDASHSAQKMGLLLENAALVGFTMESSKDPSKHTVLRLGSQVHKKFLDVATGGGIEWDTSDRFGGDAEEVASFPEYMATLPIQDEAESRGGRCTGLLIAPSYVLTMASCLNTTRGGFLTAEFTKRGGETLTRAVRADFQVPSPLYETPGDFQFDVAVIGLSEPVLDITPIVLNPGFGEWIQNATIQLPRFSILSSGPEMLEPSSQVLLDCHNSSSPNVSRSRKPGKDFLPPRGVCISAETNMRSSRLFPPGKPLISRTHFGVLSASGFSIVRPDPSAGYRDVNRDLPGDESPNFGAGIGEGDNDSSGGQPGDGSQEERQPQLSSDVFMSFADNANFINGYVSGVNWGQRVKAKTPPPSLVPQTIPNYVVGLRISKDGPNFCSGTLVASSYVLTAAHCVGDALVKFVEVAGDSHSDVLPVLADSIVVHQSYGKKFQFSYDAAVLELQTPASSRGVAIDKAADYASKTPAAMFGFGVMSSAELEKPSSVHPLELPLYSRKQCSATLPNIDDSMLCAGGESGQDACQGDSGGPLVLRSGAEDYLVGIVSAGYGCGLVGVPGVYARASSLVDFLQSYVVGHRFGVSSSSSPTVSPSTPTATPSSQSPANESREAVDSDDLESYSRGRDNGTNTNSSSVQTRKTVFETPIKSVVVSSGLKVRVKVELFAFLMSDSYLFLESPQSSVQKVVDPRNTVTMYSRGDISGILNMLQRHNANARHNRKDRFQRGVNVSTLWDKSSHRVSKDVCLA